jgi:alpha-1,3-glucosyltransferase
MALEKEFQQSYFITSTAGLFSLFPLLFEPREFLIKCMVFSIFMIYLGNHLILSWNSKLYILGTLILAGYIAMLHTVIFCDKLAFFPLMITSVYTGLGVTFGFMDTYYNVLFC